MNRLSVIIIAFVVVLASFGPRADVALETGPASEMAMEVEMEAGNENSPGFHSQMSCCDQPAHSLTDHQSHCGISCAIVADRMTTVAHTSKTALIPAKLADHVGSDQELPKRPPRALL